MNIDDLYRMLRTGHSQLQGVVDTMPDPLLVLDANLCVLSANRAFFEKFRVDRFETMGRRIYELGNGQWDGPELRTLLENVIPRVSAIIDYQIDHEFPEIGLRSMLLTARTLYHPDSVSRNMLLSIVDATERLKREAANQLILGEMQHRMKNLLSSTQALARLSRTDGRTASEFRDEFLARFRNLILSSEVALSADSGGLRSLVQTALAPYATPESVVVLPDEDIDPGPTILTSLGLVLHELATNAAKYGALSVPEGKIEIDWAYDLPRGGFWMKWSERQGPVVSPPSSRGYGSKLIESTIFFTLGGELEQSFQPEGLVVELFVPLKSEGIPSKDAPVEKEQAYVGQGSGG